MNICDNAKNLICNTLDLPKISAKEEYQSYGTIFKWSVVILVVVKTILTYEENV